MGERNLGERSTTIFITNDHLCVKQITPSAIMTADSITTSTVSGMKNDIRTPTPKAKTPNPIADFKQNLDFIGYLLGLFSYDKYM